MRKLFVLIVLFLAVGYTSAQSLKPENPYPLQEGINKGTSDSLVGTHYWYFYAVPGNNTLTVRFKKPAALYGSQMNNILTITLTDEKKTWRTTKTVTSSKNASEATFSADKVKTKMKIIVSIAPPNQNLIRMGGDYEVEVTGDAEFDAIRARNRQSPLQGDRIRLWLHDPRVGARLLRASAAAADPPRRRVLLHVRGRSRALSPPEPADATAGGGAGRGDRHRE